MGAGATAGPASDDDATSPPPPPNAEEEMALKRKRVHSDDDGEEAQLDCYSYAFSPLLLFAPGPYFDKGYSNYNAVAAFFAAALEGEVDMLEGVLCDSRNMLYEELLEHVAAHKLLVTCCIDAHFTAFQWVDNERLVYYDPARGLSLYAGEPARRLACYLLLKCSYGNSQHVQDNPENYYSAMGASTIRKMIFRVYRDLNKSYGGVGHGGRPVALDLREWFLCNARGRPSDMSLQLTGNTCYFQTYLFALLCKAGGPLKLQKGGNVLSVPDVARLERCSVNCARCLLEFWRGPDGALRPLTNANVVLDFHRHERAAYYETMLAYLSSRNCPAPNYPGQLDHVLAYLRRTRVLHRYTRFTVEGAMAAQPNTKSLQPVTAAEGAVRLLAGNHYYKFRANSLGFGFNSYIFAELRSFARFQALRKNQLLAFYDDLKPLLEATASAAAVLRGPARDYYFLAQFEANQPELVDAHHYGYAVDLAALLRAAGSSDRDLDARVRGVNSVLAEHVIFSTSRQADYEKFIHPRDLARYHQHYNDFLNDFLAPPFFRNYAALGLQDEDPRIKDVNALTRTAFYSQKLMQRQMNRMEYEFEKETINTAARYTIRKLVRTLGDGQTLGRGYKASLKIGQGYAYSKYNTLMHFLNVCEEYWKNPDLSGLALLGKDVRALINLSCQKLFVDATYGAPHYHYGPILVDYSALDLAVGAETGDIVPGATKKDRGPVDLIITDKVYERGYLKNILEAMCEKAGGASIRTDDVVVNLGLLSLLLDFGLFATYGRLLRLPHLPAVRKGDAVQLQVEVSNAIHERDKATVHDGLTRLKVEELLFECGYKFLINKAASQRSPYYDSIRALQADPDYRDYVLLVKIYVSLCQMNKSAEVDYYKIKVDGAHRIVVPRTFSRATSDYLEHVTTAHSFTERRGLVGYDDLPLFDLGKADVDLQRVRIDPPKPGVESYVRYVEVDNVFRAHGDDTTFLAFVADAALRVDVDQRDKVRVRVNQVGVEVACAYFNDAVSFVPCFKFKDSDDVLLVASPHVRFKVDDGGQHHVDYYGMREELVDCVESVEVFVDLNDEHAFKTQKLGDLVTESRAALYAPDFVLQVSSRQHLINLLYLACSLRNLSLFILVLFQLRRCSVALEFKEGKGDKKKITGPWLEAINYVLGRAPNPRYDAIFRPQFHDVDAFNKAPLPDFVDGLCEVFTKFQRVVDGRRQIVPTPKQKAFLAKIISAPESFHFSEVGSGKTKVILPLFCMAFLSSNEDCHRRLARGGRDKHCLVVLVPEHLVPDAKAQVYRYALALNFRSEYRVYDDIFALLHDDVLLGARPPSRYKPSYSFQRSAAPTPAPPGPPPHKSIFVTSFNSFKKALTYDAICNKVWPNRDRVLVLVDEVDDFLDRDKLVFNICSNKANDFSRHITERYHATARAAYEGAPPPPADGAKNPAYWRQLHDKFASVHAEVQDASRSLNKSFGVFTEATLRHCATNLAQDLEGYRSLIARPYESVNRAMPGSYYSDVERTIYLTYYCLMEDTKKYDQLFQQERKFLSFEYFSEFVEEQGVEYDDLVYGHEPLSALCAAHPGCKAGLTRFLYEIVLRRTEVRDKARSVNSVDVVLNFDCVGFTGTPFIDNYPTLDYIRGSRTGAIPDLIDRRSYAHAFEKLDGATFEARFRTFQGANTDVEVRYASSSFVAGLDERGVLRELLKRGRDASPDAMDTDASCNVLVDLCGVFKRSSIEEIRDALVDARGDAIRYVYHVDPADGADRILDAATGTDVPFDEEFYAHLARTRGAQLGGEIFFFVDNRNVIGKDVPFQQAHLRQFGSPLFRDAAVLAHDVDDFSKIWQAMGRSRTMARTTFTIYSLHASEKDPGPPRDIVGWPLTRDLYVRNCDSKIAGNLSSIYQTIIALVNLYRNKFYYGDEIVDDFLARLDKSLSKRVATVAAKLTDTTFAEGGRPAALLAHILAAKLRVATNDDVSDVDATPELARTLVGDLVRQKFEVRAPTDDARDALVAFLSGDVASGREREISYTKQQQKQKQKQQNKNQDADTMEPWDRKHQLPLSVEVPDYYAASRDPSSDDVKACLALPIPKEIFRVSYSLGGARRVVRVFPTVQFLYSHHARSDYVDDDVKRLVKHGRARASPDAVRDFFLSAVGAEAEVEGAADPRPADAEDLAVSVELNRVRQNPAYSLLGVRRGVYVIGTKDQLTKHDLAAHPLGPGARYVADEHGFVLHDRDPTTRRLDEFGPYCVEHYVLMDALSKAEVASNVLDYYCRRKDDLQKCLDSYGGAAGAGFVCWRFVMMDASRARVLRGDGDSSSGSLAAMAAMEVDEPGSSRAEGSSRFMDPD